MIKDLKKLIKDIRLYKKTKSKDFYLEKYPNFETPKYRVLFDLVYKHNGILTEKIMIQYQKYAKKQNMEMIEHNRISEISGIKDVTSVSLTCDSQSDIRPKIYDTIKKTNKFSIIIG